MSTDLYSIGNKEKDRFSLQDNCIGCGLCQMVCPTGAIEMEDGRPEWYADDCTGCDECMNRCPVKAIIYRQKG